MKEYIICELEKLSLPQIIGYLQIILALLSWYAILIWKRKEVFVDFRGKDKVWQFVEWVAIFWLTFGPASLVAFLLGVPFGKEIFSFLEITFFVAILGKSAEKIAGMRFGIAPESGVTKTKLEITKTETKKETTDGTTDTSEG